MSNGKIGFVENISTRRMSQCQRCIHYLGKASCKAFPEKFSIPRKFITETVKHELTLGNQIGDYVYTPHEKYTEQDSRDDLMYKKALLNLESNKRELPQEIIKEIDGLGGNLELIEKLEIKSSWSFHRRSFTMEFFPSEQLVELDVRKFGVAGIAQKINLALRAVNKEPSFKLTILKNGEYFYE